MHAVNLVLENATLLDCTGRDPQPNRRVVVENERILRIGATDGPSGPRDARVIDCQGRTLMPGLLDAHVHLASLDLDPVAEVRLAPAVIAFRIPRPNRGTPPAGFPTGRGAGGLGWG